MEEYSNILVVFLTGLVPILLTLYLNERVKGSVKNSFDEKLEQLKKEHSKELSHFQTELNYLKTKENFKFTKLHEKRFEVLQESYTYLNKTLMQLGVYINPVKIVPFGKTSQEHNDLLNEQYTTAHNNFLKYFGLIGAAIAWTLRAFFDLCGLFFIAGMKSKKLIYRR